MKSENEIRLINEQLSSKEFNALYFFGAAIFMLLLSVLYLSLCSIGKLVFDSGNLMVFITVSGVCFFWYLNFRDSAKKYREMLK